MSVPFLLFFVCGVLAVTGALLLIWAKEPIHSALSLVLVMVSLAVLYLLLGGEFVAAGQVLVYGGAVMVMFLFVIAYLGDRSEESPWSGGPSWLAVGAALAGGAILAEVIVVVGLSTGNLLSKPQHIGRSFGSPASIGRLFLTDHLIAFEATSIVLLVAAVGGVVLGAHARRIDPLEHPHPERADARA